MELNLMYEMVWREMIVNTHLDLCISRDGKLSLMYVPLRAFENGMMKVMRENVFPFKQKKNSIVLL